MGGGVLCINGLYPVNYILNKSWLASRQAGSIGGAMRIGVFWEEDVVHSHDSDTEEARCDCLAKKGTEPCG